MGYSSENITWSVIENKLTKREISIVHSRVSLTRPDLIRRDKDKPRTGDKSGVKHSG